MTSRMNTYAIGERGGQCEKTFFFVMREVGEFFTPNHICADFEFVYRTDRFNCWHNWCWPSICPAHLIIIMKNDEDGDDTRGQYRVWMPLNVNTIRFHKKSVNPKDKNNIQTLHFTSLRFCSHRMTANIGKGTIQSTTSCWKPEQRQTRHPLFCFVKEKWMGTGQRLIRLNEKSACTSPDRRAHNFRKIRFAALAYGD